MILRNRGDNVTQEEIKWIDVILNLYSDLPLSNGVIRHTDIRDKKRKRIMDYLNKIAEYSKKCFVNRYSSFEKHCRSIFYYRNYVIKSSDIPQSYYDAQLRLAQKSNPKKISFTDQEKKEIVRNAINDQKRSLDPWIDYFVHGNGRFFPIYEQYWVFQGLQKLGQYDIHTGKFGKRNKNTVYPFPELNEAAVEMTITLMENFISSKKVIPGIEDAFYSYNFRVLYEFSLKIVLEKASFKCNEGIWKKYDCGSDSDILLSELRGKHTGWCVERSSWSGTYLSESDFYIFYTRDINGNFSDPRLCIRVIGDRVVEVRGIGPSQNIELEMLSILEEKLNEFDFSDFSKNLIDMKKLNLVEEKLRMGVILSKEDLEFLYEIHNIISWFGRSSDPIVKQIIDGRDKYSDLMDIFGVSKDEIALDISRITDNTKVYLGDIVYQESDGKFLLSCDDEVEEGDTILCDHLIIPEYILGNFYLRGYSGKETLPKLVSRSFSVFCPSYLRKLSLPEVGVHLSVYGLTAANEIVMSDRACYDVIFYDLSSVDKMSFPKILYGDLKLPRLTRADGFVFPRVVSDDVFLPFLFKASNVCMPKIIGGNLRIDNLFDFDGEMSEDVRGIIVCNNISFSEDDSKLVMK